MQQPSTSRGHLCGASGEPKAKPGALLFATMLPSDRPGNPEPFSPPLAKYRSAQKANVRQSKRLQRGQVFLAGICPQGRPVGMVSLNRSALYNPFIFRHLTRTRHSFRGPFWNPNCSDAALGVAKEVWNG